MDRIGFRKTAYTRDLARLWRLALVDVHHQRNRPQSRPHWRESYSGDLLPSVRKITSAPRTELSRRQLVTTALALAASILIGERFSGAAEPDVRFDFSRPIEGWETVSGKWSIEEVPGALQGGRALVQRATDNAFNVIVAPSGPYTNVDVAVRFKPISGREDASGGIVFRFSEGHYYVIRANAFVQAPALGQWHKLRIRAEGDRIQGWLNDQHLIDYHDSRFASGRIGLWTKADSVTAFDDLVIRAL